jgi:hypothetical protein
MGKSYLVNGMTPLVTTSCTCEWLEDLAGDRRVWVNLGTIQTLAEAPALPQMGGTGRRRYVLTSVHQAGMIASEKAPFR